MIVETKLDFLEFQQEYNSNDVILLPILCDVRRNPLNNELCLLFVKILNSEKYFILPFAHSETTNLNINVLNHLNVNNKKYVIDKKKLLNIFQFNNMIDINVMNYLNNNSIVEIEQKYTNAELYLLKTHSDTEFIYKSIPILKIQERLLDYAKKLEITICDNKNAESEPSFEFLNDLTINNLHEVESAGLYVDKEKLLHYFPDYGVHIIDNYIYTDYNIYTLTGRPSNRFGNLNFAALHKDTGEREFIISRFGKEGKLVYFDYEAYHLNLIANLIGYTFPSDISIHEYLGRYYFNKPQLTEDEYNESKGVSFNILYGGIHESIAKEVPFFGKAKPYIDEMWKDYITNGYIETEISKKKLHSKNFTDMNKNKIFNYFLQAYETENNMLIMEKISKLLESYNTKLIMYLYDAFLLDFNKKDGKELVYLLKKMMENDGKHKVKVSIGNNFNELKKCNI